MVELEPDARDDGDGRPLQDCGRLIEAGGLRWYTQQLGEGPSLLLIHGTGSSGHSWHRLAPLLAARWRLTMLSICQDMAAPLADPPVVCRWLA